MKTRKLFASTVVAVAATVGIGLQSASAMIGSATGPRGETVHMHAYKGQFSLDGTNFTPGGKVEIYVNGTVVRTATASPGSYQCYYRPQGGRVCMLQGGGSFTESSIPFGNSRTDVVVQDEATRDRLVVGGDNGSGLPQ